MSQESIIYIEHDDPSFGYAIGLFTLKCVVILALLLCASFCLCSCGLCGSKNKLSDDELRLSKTNFKITKYKNIRSADCEYFKTQIEKTKKNTNASTNADSINPKPNKELNSAETKSETKSEQSNLIELNSSDPKSEQSNLIESNLSDPKSEQLNNKSNIGLNIECSSIECSKSSGTFWKSIIRKLSCGYFYKENILSNNTKENDLENNKKKYVLYKFNNLNLDESLDDPSQFVKNDPYKNLKDFTEIIFNTYEPHDFEILLHISSPGGVAFKFEELHANLERLTKKGFIITALVDDFCASGGYMLATACDKIIASNYARIGSVGVICTAVNYYELSQKIGFTQKTFKTGKYKESFPTGSQCTQEDDDRMNELLKETLQIFSGMVKKSRNLSDEEMETILSAKVWTGQDALDKKLIDKLSLSSDYLYDLSTSSEIYVVTAEKKKKNVFGDFTGLYAIANISAKFLNNANTLLEIVNNNNHSDNYLVNLKV